MTSMNPPSICVSAPLPCAPLIYCTSTAVPMATAGLLLLLLAGLSPGPVSHSVRVALGRKNVKASAVCRFSLSDVQEAFQGPYMENQDSGSKWEEYTGKIPDPRPGTVNTPTLPASLSSTQHEQQEKTQSKNVIQS